MASLSPTKQSFLLPKLKYKFKTTPQADRFAFFDVKFWPYTRHPDEEPVFAVVGQKQVLIGRLSTQSNALVTMLHELEDEQETRNPDSPGLNSCSWCYIDPQRPLLAVAGGSGQLKVIDAVEGERFSTLLGHGAGTINDIATHPIYPWIVATASMDKSLRIWDLRRHAHRHLSATIIICGQATGHCEGVLTASWHPSGRYLITGGHDQRVCVWTIPDLADESKFWEDISPAHRLRSSHEVLTIYFPHFISAAVHSNFVDCARFFGDLVMSKAAGENRIVLWKITGFDSRKPPPDTTTAPKLDDFLDTRNGFMRTTGTDGNGIDSMGVAQELEDQPLYERVLEFETPYTEQFYLRFGLLLPSPDRPDIHPVLAFAHAASELRFWDLARLSLGHAGGVDEAKVSVVKRKKKSFLPIKVPERPSRVSSTPQTTVSGENKDSPSIAAVRDSPTPSISNISSSPWPMARQSSTEATSELSADNVGNAPPVPARDREKYAIHEPFEPIRPHSKVSLAELQHKNLAHFNARAADWSPCGRWCIVAGESARTTPQGTEGIGGFAVLYR